MPSKVVPVWLYCVSPSNLLLCRSQRNDSPPSKPKAAKPSGDRRGALRAERVACLASIVLSTVQAGKVGRAAQEKRSETAGKHHGRIAIGEVPPEISGVIRFNLDST
jgi:hypothetical protein